MPRRKRIWYPGAIYHVMSRGNRKKEIFKERADYVDFLKILKSINNEYGFKIHSLCLMTNHFHFVIETIDTELWRIMQKILSIYAESFNYRYGYTGHLFQGRYTCSLIENESHFLEVSRYIHLNPVKAKMVKKPLAYEYSSYSLFVTEAKNHPRDQLEELIGDLVDTSRVLSWFQQDCEERYRVFVEGKLSHADVEMQIQKDMKEDDLWLPQ